MFSLMIFGMPELFPSSLYRDHHQLFRLTGEMECEPVSDHKLTYTYLSLGLSPEKGSLL